MDVFEQVKEAICKVQPGIDAEKITPGASLTDDLEIDSLDMVELTLALEDALDLRLPDEELEGIVTVKDVISLVEAKLKEKDA